MGIKWSSKIRRRFNRAMNPVGSDSGLGDLLDTLWSGVGTYEKRYYVDGTNGNDSSSGETPDDAFATYTKARTVSNASISWSATPKRRNLIVVMAGTYAETFMPPYYADVVGLGTLGPDTSAKFKPAAGSALAYSTTPTLGMTLLSTGLYNLWFESVDATPVARITTMQGSIIDGCMFYSGGSSTYGIHMGCNSSPTGMKSSIIRNSRFATGNTVLTHGIYFDEGANVYFHNSVVKDCNIRSSTAGIYIAANCTATLGLIKGNFIARPTKGIDDNNGNSYCFGNWITAGTDAIEHANSSTQCIDNHVINNATGAVEASGTS